MMRKKNGFVFVETMVVVSVLSLILIMLFVSYSYILRKSRERVNFDTTEMIYKTFYVKQIIDNFRPLNSPYNGVEYFINSHLKVNGGMCEKTGSYNSYICNLNGHTGDLVQITKAFEIDKIYYLNPHEILTSNNMVEWLNYFDATTIDYILKLGSTVDKNLLVVKYKKQYNSNANYEVIHSSMEVV